MKERTKENILGCFVSGPPTRYGDSNSIKEFALKRGELFRSYIWGENGISIFLKKLDHKDYGSDLVLILFEFYLNPFREELDHFKEIESYRKRERSIGVPIIVNEENFFMISESERKKFLKESILRKIDLVGIVVKKRKLDTKIEKLKSDLISVLDEY